MNFNKIIDDNKKIIILFFFISTFFLGISVTKDYGVSSDEYLSRIKGFVTLNYLGQKISPSLTNKIKGEKNIPPLEDFKQKTYGPIFDAPASFVEIIIGIDDKRDQLLLRHYMNFVIFFISLICFYKIILLKFGSWKLALIGTLFLILSPRIFANSFYNSKDLVFMSFIIFAMYFNVKFIEIQNYKNLIYCSIFSALAVDIRIVGINIIVNTLCILIFQNFLKKEITKKLPINFYYLILTFLFIVIFWPYLWESPIRNFIFAFQDMAHFYRGTENLFFGNYIDSKDVPWFYIPAWILITTPLYLSLLFFIGCSYLAYKITQFFLQKNKPLSINMIYDLYFILIVFSSILAVIIFNSTLYNGWRQLYFVYPAFLLITITGLNFILKKIKNGILNKLFVFFLITNILTTFLWMIKNHPHQYAYFNFLVGSELNKKFDVDYYGLSYKENFHFLIKNDSSNKIFVYNLSKNNRLFYHLLALNDEDRQKIIEVKDIENADYLITNYHIDKTNYDENFFNKYKIFNDVKVGNNSINTVYKKIN